MASIPLQPGSGAVQPGQQPTLVPNFFPQRSFQDPTGTGKSVMSAQAPADIAAASGNRSDATATVTIGGTINNGDVITVTVTNPVLPNGSMSWSYTAAPGNSATVVAAGLAAAINADQIAGGYGISASANAAVLTISHEGPTGNFSVVSFSTTGSETGTITPAGGAMSGGGGFIIPTQNFTFSAGGVMDYFYYGVPKDVPYNQLVLLISQGMPIA